MNSVWIRRPFAPSPITFRPEKTKGGGMLLGKPHNVVMAANKNGYKWGLDHLMKVRAIKAY